MSFFTDQGRIDLEKVNGFLRPGSQNGWFPHALNTPPFDRHRQAVREWRLEHFGQETAMSLAWMFITWSPVAGHANAFRQARCIVVDEVNGAIWTSYRRPDPMENCPQVRAILGELTGLGSFHSGAVYVMEKHHAIRVDMDGESRNFPALTQSLAEILGCADLHPQADAILRLTLIDAVAVPEVPDSARLGAWVPVMTDKANTTRRSTPWTVNPATLLHPPFEHAVHAVPCGPMRMSQKVCRQGDVDTEAWSVMALPELWEAR